MSGHSLPVFELSAGTDESFARKDCNDVRMRTVWSSLLQATIGTFEFFLAF
jgi:hypothetical protein